MPPPFEWVRQASGAVEVAAALAPKSARPDKSFPAIPEKAEEKKCQRKRNVRRNKKGEFKKEVKVGKSLAADRKRTAKTKVKKGQGDRGDVKR
jgi:hypothetical protein